MDDHPRIALSSCWCSARHDDGYAMCAEMADLGFDHVELSHGVRLTLVEGILRAVDEGVVRVSSVHNFCPLPPHVSFPAPNLYEPTARDPRVREQWFRHSSRTLEFAGRVGADLAIFHSGSVPFLFSNPVEKLQRLAQRDRSGQEPAAEGYLRQLEKVLRKVERKSRSTLPRLLESFQRILPIAAAQGVRIAVENRESLSELPLDPQFPDFLARFPPDAPIGYWHDAGHAQLKQQMQVFPHRQLLEQNASRQLGFHLHDVSPAGEDHRPIGTGTIDWEMVRDFIAPEHTLVIELSPRLTPDEVRSSRAFLLDLLAQTGGQA